VNQGFSMAVTQPLGNFFDGWHGGWHDGYDVVASQLHQFIKVGRAGARRTRSIEGRLVTYMAHHMELLHCQVLALSIAPAASCHSRGAWKIYTDHICYVAIGFWGAWHSD
jgi:hypothetical protein